MSQDLTRVYNWDTDLIAFATAIQGLPFVWGETDCGSVAHEALRVMYGDEFKVSKPNYTTRIGALRWLSRNPIEFYLLELGAYLIDSRSCRGGDIIIETIDPVALAVCTNSFQVLKSVEDEDVRVEKIDYNSIFKVMRFPDGNRW